MRWAREFQCASSVVGPAPSSRASAAFLSVAAAAVSIISWEKSLIETLLAIPSIYTVPDHRRCRRSAPRQPDRIARLSLDREPTKSRRLRAMAIERHRCRIYEMSYVFDGSTSSCWSGKNTFDVLMSSIISNFCHSASNEPFFLITQ